MTDLYDPPKTGAGRRDQEIRELRATVLQLEEENACLRAAILSVNERLAQLIVLDEDLACVITRLEAELS